MELGEFGAAVRELEENPEPDTFRFCGEQFAVVGRIPPMLMLQLGASATGKIEEAEGLAAMWESLRCSLTSPVQGDKLADGAEFARFYKAAVAHDVDLDDIMKLTFKLFEAQAGRPTKRASASSAGVLSTSPSSRVLSIHPGHPPLRPVSEVLAG